MRNASLFNPPGKPAPSITVFKELVLCDLQQIKFKRECQKDINEGIASLCERKNVIIRPADKGRDCAIKKAGIFGRNGASIIWQEYIYYPKEGPH